jgi:class 3 adenylate cyclase
MDRKLAAILAADVVGYAALMERDEKGTHERLIAGRKELFEPEIARHHGRVFKLMGDGLLAEFGSVVDAVECAVSLQRGLAERNAAIAVRPVELQNPLACCPATDRERSRIERKARRRIALKTGSLTDECVVQSRQ